MDNTEELQCYRETTNTDELQRTPATLSCGCRAEGKGYLYIKGPTAVVDRMADDDTEVIAQDGETKTILNKFAFWKFWLAAHEGKSAYRLFTGLAVKYIEAGRTVLHGMVRPQRRL